MNSLPVGKVLHITFVCFCLLLSGVGKPGLASAADIGTFLQNTLLGAAGLNGGINTASSPGAGAAYLKDIKLVGNDILNNRQDLLLADPGIYMYQRAHQRMNSC